MKPKVLLHCGTSSRCSMGHVEASSDFKKGETLDGCRSGTADGGVSGDRDPEY
jgi:hypothetical protein